MCQQFIMFFNVIIYVFHPLVHAEQLATWNTWIVVNISEIVCLLPEIYPIGQNMKYKLFF